MVVIGFILLLIAYTVGVIAIVLEIICYRKGVEYFETILLSLAFLLLIFSLSIYSILDVANQAVDIKPSNFMNLSLVGLALMVPLNVFAERQITIQPWIRCALYSVSGLITILLVSQMLIGFETPVHWLAYVFLGVSILYSMIIVRTTKPDIHIAHQEKIEQTMSIAIITILPLFLLIEFFWDSDVPITISVFFIILAVCKIIDNTKRLSLLKPTNTFELKEDNTYNLTTREQEVTDLLVKGHTYAKIAEDLFISMPTVKTHVSNIYRKVGVKNKMELFYTLMK